MLPTREKAKDGLKPVQVTVIIATETNPPPGEKAIEWTLLTSIPVFDLEAALQIIQWYLCRWQIEKPFKTPMAILMSNDMASAPRRLVKCQQTLV